MGRRRKLSRGSRHIYGPVDSPSDIRRYNRIIRNQIRKADSRARLTELVKRSQYFYTLTFSPAWADVVRRHPEIREVAYEEYLRTARVANQVARKHGWPAEYGPE